MPRVAIKDNSRVALRVRPADKARIMRAAALQNTDMTALILRGALREADAVIKDAERVVLSERDTKLWLKLLDNPPKANARLVAAVKAMPQS